MRTPTLPAFALVALAFASGCNGKTVAGEPEPIDSSTSTLHRSRDCNELLGDLHADAIAKLNKQIDQMIEGIRDCRAALGDQGDACNYYYGSSGGSRGEFATDDGAAAPEASNGGGTSSGSSGSPTGGGDLGTGGSGDSPSVPSHSDTNTQVDGVDEADIVKTDGTHLYVLHGATFRIVQAYPMNSLAELGTTNIEGTPTEMFVENGLAVIFSRVDGQPIYAAAGVTPPANGSSGGLDVPIAPGGYYGYGGYYANPLTKITVLRIAADNSTSVEKETYLEGEYLSSRRVQNQVRTVLTGNGSYELTNELMQNAAEQLGLNDTQPADIVTALEQVRTQAIANVTQIGLDRFLPRTFDKSGNAITAAPLACGNAFTPTAGSTEGGLTEVSTLDLGNLAQDTREVAIFGQAGTVYGNDGTLYLAAPSWGDTPWGGGIGWAVTSPTSPDVAAPPPTSGNASSSSSGAIDGGAATEPGTDPDTKNVDLLDDGATTVARPELPEVISLGKTHVHKFTFGSDGNPVYEASGTLEGTVKDQFSLDEQNGILRIATTEQRGYRSEYETGTRDARPHSLNHVFALASENGSLNVRGSVKDLGADEQIYSVRFVGNRGYVVTFRQVDPLFVIDLGNPAAPSLLGELTIPGFSEYMHPLDDSHLLTIGQDTESGGRALALQIFDVSNPTAPQRTQKFVYDATNYGYSEASYEHKAFTYFAQNGTLAFPYTSYNSNNGAPTSTLELFKVDLANGFTRLGDIDHSQFFQNQQSACYWVDPSVRRGLFIENVAYSVSNGGVIAKDLSDLAGAGVSLALPNVYPDQPSDCGYGGTSSGSNEGDAVDGGAAPPSDGTSSSGGL